MPEESSGVSERLLTARELGQYLGVAPGTILDWWEQRRIPGFKFGRAVRFDLEEVLAAGRPDGGGETPVTPPRPATGVVSPLPVTRRGGEHA
jgi:excisionase family DNA binding protein